MHKYIGLLAFLLNEVVGRIIHVFDLLVLAVIEIEFEVSEILGVLET
jgi:hypothetical protein